VGNMVHWNTFHFSPQIFGKALRKLRRNVSVISGYILERRSQEVTGETLLKL